MSLTSPCAFLFFSPRSGPPYLVTSVVILLLFGLSVVSNSLWLHGEQHARLPRPSLFPGACSSSCPLIWWCHPTISSSVSPFSPCLQSFPAPGSFPVSWLLASSHQIYWNFSFSIGPSNEYSGLISFSIDWFDLLPVQGCSRVFSSSTVQKHQFFGAQPSLWSNSHIRTWLLEKPSLWLDGPLSTKWCLWFLICCLDYFNVFGFVF